MRRGERGGACGAKAEKGGRWRDGVRKRKQEGNMQAIVANPLFTHYPLVRVC